jgi:gliding motility-associated-like protein
MTKLSADATPPLLRKPCKILYLTIIACFFSSSLWSQLSTAFTATPTSGCAPLLVNFTDQSTGGATGWRWDLGNGTISSQQNPSTTYLTPGLYTVKLIITNAAGKDSLVKTNYINVLQPPQVAFTTSTSTVGCFPLRVQFVDNSVSTSGGTITSWEWDFGDGTTSTAQNPYHVYYNTGNYNVALKVTNSSGCFTLLVKPSFIRASNGVKADFSPSSPVNCKPPEAITFTNLTTGPGTITYKWDFGDGGNSIATNPVHTYTTAGTFNVRLIAESDQGCIDTITKNNSLSIGNFNSNFSFRDSVCIGDTVKFTNQSIPVPGSATWYFGDGTTSITANPIKIFSTTGAYTVKLVNNYGACVDSSIKTINVISNPVPNIIVNDSISCRAPFTVNFSNTTAGAKQWLWDFGDGTISTQQNPSHTYTVEGNYTVKLTVQLSAGCSGTLTKTNFIRVQKPVVSILGMPTGGCFPYTFNPVPSVISADSVASWLWDFGDGGTSTQQLPSHLYPGQGNYTIRLTITTKRGCTETITYVDGVKTGTKPVANFSAAPLTSCAGQPVNFTNLSTGSPDAFRWEFGDNGTSTLQNPSYAYNKAGLMSVTLIAYKNGCGDTLTKTNYINILPPVSNFGIVYDCNTTSTVSFVDSSIGAITRLWNFGDGNTSGATNPMHVYASPGTYTVTLSVTNGSCTDTSQRVVNFLNFSPTIVTDQNAKCRFQSFAFSAGNVTPANITSWFWDLGDGNTSNSASFNHLYTTVGSYTVKLVITDINGCKDSTTKVLNVFGATPSFTALPNPQCVGQSVTFTSTSTTDGTHPITNYLWRFGDGNNLNGNNATVQHSFTTASTYFPKLIVTDSYGCIDSTLTSTILDVFESKLGFYAVDSLSCPNGNVQFVNTSTGSNLSYTWDFGDGNTSTAVSPSHSYAATGTYTVKLIGREAIGCVDSVIRTNYITVDVPIANFIASDTFTICPPLQVQFTNTSTFYKSILWNFGDGNTSTAANPSYSYAIPNDYIVTLTVTSAGGCTSTKQMTIRVLSNTIGNLSYNPITGCFPMQVNFAVTANNNVKYLWDFGDGNTLFTTDSTVGFNYQYPGYYVPKVILQDTQGCLTPLIGIDTIKIFGSKPDFGVDKKLLCDNGIVQFRDSSVTADIVSSYLWNFGDGNTSALRNPSHTYTSTGVYDVTLTINTVNSCSNTITKPQLIKVAPTPQLSITGTTLYCSPATVNLTGNLINPDTSAIQWTWKIDNRIVNTKNLSNFSIPTAGTYTAWLIATNSSGCTDSTSTTITVNQTPTIDAGKDTTICIGSSFVLTPSGATSYLWSPGTDLNCTNCTNPVSSAQNNIRYYVTGTSSGCSTTDSIFVRVKKPFTVTISANDTLCLGESIRLQASGAELYSWSPATGLSSSTINNPLATPATTTTYTVIGSDSSGCFTDTRSVTVYVYNYPTINAGNDTVIIAGTTAQLLAIGSPDVISYNWSPFNTLTCTTCTNPVANPKNNTTYKVEVSNIAGCKSFDEVTVLVGCLAGRIYIPNAFTPNNDGKNDRFFVIGDGVDKIKRIIVYDRWGKPVYSKENIQGNNPAVGWDGTLNGYEQQPGMYTYVAEVVCGDGAVFKMQGTITLIR